VHVNTFRGDVQLSGFVDNEQQKERAGQIAREVAGVQNVTNNLEIKPGAVGAPGGTVSSSSGAITQPVPERPAADLQNNLAPAATSPAVVTPPPPATGPYGENNRYEVQTSNGQATIRGAVSSESEKRDIERRVREMPGVQSVDDQLRVEPPR
jgi:hypothetical protein